MLQFKKNSIVLDLTFGTREQSETSRASKKQQN